MTARILPRNASVSNWSVTESVDSPTADGNVDQSVAQATVDRFSTMSYHTGSNLTLETDFGSFTGRAASDSVSRPFVDDGAKSQVVIRGLMSAFDVTRSIPPFHGGLDDYFAALCRAVGYTGRKSVSWGSHDAALSITGFQGNVFQKLTQLLTTIGYQWMQVRDAVIVRPRRKYVLDWSGFIGEPSIQTQSGSVRKTIRTFLYDQEWGSDLKIYPAEGLYVEESRDEIQNVDHIPLAGKSMDATSVLSVQDRGYGFENAVSEQSFDVSASLLSVNDPVCSLPPCFRHLFDTGGTVSVYGFMGKWVLLGTEDFVVDAPAALPKGPGVGGGSFARCTSNGVYYYCTVGYSSETGDDGTVTTTPASWHEFGSFNGDTVTGSAARDAYLAAHADIDHTQGFYCVTGSDGYPMMPKQWLDHGGSVRVSVDPVTTRIKVRVTAPSIGLEVPVYVRPPSDVVGLKGKVGDMVAFDPTGAITQNSLVYEWKDANDTEKTPAGWSLMDDQSPFPYSPYKIAIGTYNGDYPGLYVTGSGIRWSKTPIDSASSHAPSDDGLDEADNRIEVDNPFVVTADRAGEVAHGVDEWGNGAGTTVSVTMWHRAGGARFSHGSLGSMKALGAQLDSMGLDAMDDIGAWGIQNGVLTMRDFGNWFMDAANYTLAADELGNVVGSHVRVENATSFDATSVTVNEQGIQASGPATTTLGDMDWQYARVRPYVDRLRTAWTGTANASTSTLVRESGSHPMTLGDLSAVFDAIGAHEGRSYTLGDWSTEPMRAKVVTR